MRLSLRDLVMVVAIGKAAVAGAGLGIALLGALDVTFAVSAQEWWQAVRPDALMNGFAGVGAAFGALYRFGQIIVS